MHWITIDTNCGFSKSIATLILNLDIYLGGLILISSNVLFQNTCATIFQSVLQISIIPNGPFVILDLQRFGTRHTYTTTKWMDLVPSHSGSKEAGEDQHVTTTNGLYTAISFASRFSGQNEFFYSIAEM